MATSTNAEEFATVLGVTVVEVDDLDGDCAVYDHDTHTIEVCRHLCWRRRGQAFDELLPLLGRANL